ncbi:MAG: flagellar hook-length control protein FliK [Lachnospiraceae bacterium]|nr:flagellar hook-length control protein FliK [Lachnospiraceae bacterium]
MTSTQVMGTRAGFMDMLSPVSNTTKSETADFKSFLNLSNNKNNLESISQPVSMAGKKQNTAEETTSDEPVVNRKVNKTENVQTTTEKREVSGDDIDKVEKAVDEVVETIKDELDLTDEEVVAVLETLGLTPIALLNPDNLKEFVMEAMQVEDPIVLATDENLLESLNKLEEAVTNVVENLSENLGIDDKEFLDAIEKFQNVEPETETLERTEVKEPVKDSKAPVVEDAKITAAIEVVVSDEVKNTEEPLDRKNDVETSKEDSKLHNFSVHNESRETQEIKPASDTQKGSYEGLNKEGDHKTSSNILSFAENLVKDTVAALNENSEGVSFTTVEATRIINQITESIKTQVTSETTEINMRLHPESLGNVNVRLAANNEGIITARFIAENEAVKNVLEAQAASLKETLQSKGVTIEAVEVMVESHRFDENFNRERSNEGNPSKQKKGVRRLNLSDEALNDGTSVENEADTLIKDIMRQNGNTIDYTA